ncbi:hypothetical protein BDV96DRAFT_649122 [Lophiotrema nucula]|uniref:Uncharacterized protein n=1 Tax=Lophiotrema nucula TaxID=690887 RepID=A0A6A5YZU6_9PLEO|nr:hypothetical protein BDV96DRAFT_649122 [Lophiotrema nucula]
MDYSSSNNNNNEEPLSRVSTPESFDFIPSPAKYWASLHGPKTQSGPEYERWLEYQQQPARTTTTPTPPPPTLNPSAAPFVPGLHITAPALLAVISPPLSSPTTTTADRGLPKPCPPPPNDGTFVELTHTYRRRLEGGALPTWNVIEWLSVLPPNALREDGSVELDIGWAVKCVGYAHIGPGARGRAVLLSDSFLRESLVESGIPRTVLAWLCGEEGKDGGKIVVDEEEARAFWTEFKNGMLDLSFLGSRSWCAPGRQIYRLSLEAQLVSQETDSKPKMIKRLAQQHEIMGLRDKEGQEEG